MKKFDICMNPENIAKAIDKAQKKKMPVFRHANCLSIPEVIRYIKGEVTQEECERFRFHIRTCLYCSRRSESLSRMAKN